MERLKKMHTLWYAVSPFMLTLFLIGLSVLPAQATPLGAIQSLSWDATNKWINISCGTMKVRLVYYKTDIFRIWVSSSTGAFSDAEAAGDTIKIVIYKGTPIQPAIDSTTSTAYYLIKTSECALRITKSSCVFALYDAVNTKMIFSESAPIDIGTTSKQTLVRQTNEHYYGCGAWNGHFCLTNLTAPAKYSGSYEVNNSPNPAPFYCSRMGYGAFRNTWDYRNGVYAFTSPVITTHTENRFDCFYFYGPDLKKVLRGYTDITGRPFMPPIWGLEVGIAGYFTNPTSTYGLAIDNAKKWATYGIPCGWWLPNDSYNATLPPVQQAVPALKAVNMWTGAWCGSVFNDINQRTTCVRDWGVRGFKLDCSWIGAGGKFCFNALTQTGTYGLEALSADSARIMQWTTAGWAGTQRLSIAWSGDQYPNIDWMQWNVVTGNCGAMSAQNGTTCDLAGIFDDSRNAASLIATLYVRCWQWQMWMPYLYIMDGWSEPRNRMPWNRAPSYIDPILKPSMKLRTRLAPYMYTLCADAYQTGVTANRPPLLEFPDDPTTWDEGITSDTKCKQEYMLGPWFLVRPVYENLTTATQITMWLPGSSTDRWIQYYSGQIAAPQQNVQCEVGLAPDSYNSTKPPQIPVWVLEGAIVPMWPDQYYNAGGVLIRPNSGGNTLAGSAATGPWTFDVYPHRLKPTSFSMYEDDGLTRQYKNSRFARTLLTSDATTVASNNRCALTIGPSEGTYNGKPASKTYFATFHTGIIKGNATKPLAVQVGTAVAPVPVAEKTSQALLESGADAGWYFDAAKGITWVKTANSVTTASPTVMYVDFISVGTLSDVTGRTALNSISAVSKSGTMTITFANRISGQMPATLFDLKGKTISRKLLKVVNGVAGQWDISNAVSGNYIFSIEYAGSVVSKRVMLQK